MAYDSSYYGKPRDARQEHTKAWNRTKAVAWDDRWQALSVDARRAYLLQVKAPTKEGSYTQPSVPVDGFAPAVVDELARAGLVKLEPGKGKKSARVVATQAAYDFSSRLRSIHRFHLLGGPDRVALTKFVKHAFLGQGETIIGGVLSAADVQGYCPLDEALELFVTTRRWPEWALRSCKAKAAKALAEALGKAKGPVALAKLPALIKGAKPGEVGEALTDLVVHLAAFEDVAPDTFELVVGLLPEVRVDMIEAAKPRSRPPLVACEHPKEIGPPGGLDVNDLRCFLLEVAGESPRLRRDRGIFAKDEPRLLAALPPRPGWLDDVLQTSPDRRLAVAHALAKILKFVEAEEDDKTTWLRLAGKGRTWLAAGFEEQYARVYEFYRSTSKSRAPRYYDDLDDFDDSGYDYDYSYGDSKFLGVPVSVAPYKPNSNRFHSYYQEVKPEARDALRRALWETFQALPVGVFYRWDSVLARSAFGEHNPLARGKDPLSLSIMLDRRQVARLPEQVELAGKLVLDGLLKARLLPFDAVRAAVDTQGGLCIARLPRLDGYFGRPYEADGGSGEAARVIVQPDFSVVVIGLDPGPAAELAPFCERAGGQAGQGVMTFKITRASVIRAASQGLTARAIIARLTKHASVAVPENVLREVAEWAGWIRLVNVRPVTVVRCPDKETVARVVSALGKKAERLSDTLVALHEANLSTADRAKLQEQGILVTKGDITPAPPPDEPLAPAPTTPAKKRGRPKKIR